MSKGIDVRGKAVGSGDEPLICIPLVGRSRDALLAEIGPIVREQPDLIEWRADFFAGIGDRHEVLDLCGRLAAVAAGIPLIFTIRSTREGGQPIPLDDGQVAALCVAVCESRLAGLVDFELSAPRAGLEKVRAAARATGTRLILSYHNFDATPDAAVLDARFAEAAALGADVAKVAVMPRSVDDVLELLAATSRARRAFGLPLITMAMGGYGVLTRMAGWMFGSSVTFAAGQASSAPGQLPVGELRAALGILKRAAGSR